LETFSFRFEENKGEMVNRRRQRQGQKETEGDELDRKGRRRSHREIFLPWTLFKASV